LTRRMTSQYNADWMTAWKVQDAKARFSELLETSIQQGPQVVTRRGREAAVLVPIEEWHRLQRAARPGLKALLLAPEPRFENLVPKRGKFRRRRPTKLK
jgi:antitoxin Phd